MWEKFHELMQVEPPSDGADADNGGDGTFDIYIVPSKSDWLKKGEGSDYDASGRCRHTGTGVTSTSIIMVDMALLGPPGEVPPGDSNFEPVVAHELFHAFHNALKVGAEKWWKESSATWAIHFIEASWNTEHRFDPASPQKSRSCSSGATPRGGSHTSPSSP